MERPATMDWLNNLIGHEVAVMAKNYASSYAKLIEVSPFGVVVQDAQGNKTTQTLITWVDLCTITKIAPIGKTSSVIIEDK